VCMCACVYVGGTARKIGTGFNPVVAGRGLARMVTGRYLAAHELPVCASIPPVTPAQPEPSSEGAGAVVEGGSGAASGSAEGARGGSPRRCHREGDLTVCVFHFAAGAPVVYTDWGYVCWEARCVALAGNG
jgi:hypothetical protein